MTQNPIAYRVVNLLELSEEELPMLRRTAAGKWVMARWDEGGIEAEISAQENQEFQGVRKLRKKEMRRVECIFYYLKIYKPQETTNKLEGVIHYLEAFNHFCELEAWEEAWQVLAINCDTPTREELHNQLGTWGYYRLQIEFYNQLLGKLDHKYLDGICYGYLGNAYQSLGEYCRALEFYKKYLQIAQEIGDRSGEGRAYGGLGNAYDSLGEYRCALEFHEKWLQIARETGDHSGEGRAYGGLGIAYQSLGEYRRALEFHEKWLQIARETGDLSGEGAAYGNLGNTYRNLGDYRLAIEYHQKDLEIAREIGDRSGEGKADGNLGIAYYSLGEYRRAIEFYEKDLQIAIETGDRGGEAIGWFNLGLALARVDEKWEAISAYENARNLYQAMGLDQKVEQCDRAIKNIRKWQQLKADIGNSFSIFFRWVSRWVRSVFRR